MPVFVPIHDDNPLKHIKFQYVTLLLIALNVAIFVFEQIVVDDAMVSSFAVVPAQLAQFGWRGGHAPVPLTVETLAVPERYTLLTYLFFHGDIFHIFGNMLFLWVFGDNVEDAMGHARFLVFYMACGVLAGLMHTAMQLGSTVPLIGASGSVAGVIAAYLMLHPRIRVWVIALKILPLCISALLALGAWILTQIIMVLLPQAGPVAWWAHIGGLIAGAALVVVMKRADVPLFDSRGAPPRGNIA